jgi:hypothetical protein
MLFVFYLVSKPYQKFQVVFAVLIERALVANEALPQIPVSVASVAIPVEAPSRCFFVVVAIFDTLRTVVGM